MLDELSPTPSDPAASSHLSWRRAMIFYGRYSYPPKHREEVHRRFLETDAPPPAGVLMIGRWHGAEGNNGLFIAETEDVGALATRLQD